jgi:hypothetical protein
MTMTTAKVAWLAAGPGSPKRSAAMYADNDATAAAKPHNTDVSSSTRASCHAHANVMALATALKTPT